MSSTCVVPLVRWFLGIVCTRPSIGLLQRKRKQSPTEKSFLFTFSQFDFPLVLKTFCPATAPSGFAIKISIFPPMWYCSQKDENAFQKSHKFLLDVAIDDIKEFSRCLCANIPSLEIHNGGFIAYCIVTACWHALRRVTDERYDDKIVLSISRLR